MGGNDMNAISPSSITLSDESYTLIISPNGISRNGISYSLSNHSHSGYATNSDLSSLENRVSILEGA